jgi:small ribosomal subunit Rsm22
VNWTAQDWERLAELRERFLEADAQSDTPEAGLAPSDWRSARDLALYDATFAQRIGWKWDAVFRELRLRGGLGSPAAAAPGVVVVDWGCGTGIAARRYLASAPSPPARLHLWDRSAAARAFAAECVRAEQPSLANEAGLAIETGPLPADLAPGCLLASHVLGELGPGELDELLALARRSEQVLLVEPGSRSASRRLSTVREELRGEFEVVAPCTHQAACGMLAPEQSTNWCHFFARPPSEVFQDAHWARFSRALGIDLRSLPYSFLALRRQPSSAPSSSPPGSATAGGGVRILGRPRILKGHALLDACDATGVRELALLQRLDRGLFRRLEDSAGEVVVLSLEVEGKRIRSVRNL